MVEVRQFGGGSYDTKDYPFILINKTRDKVEGRFSTLPKAHEGRLMTAINNPDDILLLMDERTNQFIDWRRKELQKFEREKEKQGY